MNYKAELAKATAEIQRLRDKLEMAEKWLEQAQQTRDAYAMMLTQEQRAEATK